MHVVLYGKPGCCLCDECETLLRSLQNEFAFTELAFTLQKIDISSDNALRERWKCHIPVITFNGRCRLALRITEGRLRRSLQRAQHQTQSQLSNV